MPSTTIPLRPIDFSHDITSLAGTPLDSRNVTLDTKTTDALRIERPPSQSQGRSVEKRQREAACKPSSVPRRTATTVIHLGRRSPDGSCSRPEGWAAHLSPRRTGVAPSYLALLRVEFAAFHSGRRRAGIVTVALVLASRRTGVTRYPALWSSDFPHARRLPGERATVRPPRWPADCTGATA